MKHSNTKHNLRIPRVPIEWYAGSPYANLDAYTNLDNVWRLPSGKALAEFALQAGFVAPLLFKTNLFKTGLPTSNLSKAEGLCADRECTRHGSNAHSGAAPGTKAAH